MISVVVPCYNQERYIKECIDSLLIQRPSVEVIVVDDGSTDASWKSIKSYGDKIIAVQQHNSGVSVARNRGLSLATQEYVSFVDGDDMWCENFSSAAERLLHEAKPDWLVGSVREHRGNTVGEPYAIGDAQIKNPEVSLLECGWGVPAQFVVRASTSRSVGGFDENLRANEDLDHWLKLASLNPNIVLGPECIAIYRIVPGSSSTQFIRLWTTRELVWQRHRNKIPKGIVQKVRRCHLDNFFRYVMVPRINHKAAHADVLAMSIRHPEFVVVALRYYFQRLFVKARICGGSIRGSMRRKGLEGPSK